MCRSIKVLHRPEPDGASGEEIREAALQFVRKVSGYRKPSQANAAVFEQAVDDVEAVVTRLLEDLQPRRRAQRNA
jgi:hypothetical protein